MPLPDENINRILKGIEKIDSNLKDTLAKKDAKIAELNDQKFQLMEQLNKLQEDHGQQVQELTKTIYEQKDQINHLSTTTEKAVQTASGFDELKNQIEEREAKLREIESRVAAVASGTTGMFLDIPTIVNYIKDRIDAANRSFRLCVPTVDFLEENGLQDLLLAIDQKCAVNVAMALDMAQHEELINNWKEHHFNVVDFWEKNLITVSANGADVGFAFVQGESISGFYTNIPELVTIFNQAITYPFMKGKKV